MTILKSVSTSIYYLLFISLLLFGSCKGQELSKMNKEVQKDNRPHFGPDAAPNAQISQFIRNIHQDKNGHLWFGTNGFGVAHYNGSEVLYYSKDEGYAGHQTTGITEDSKGNLWFATNEGIAKYAWSDTEEGKKIFTNYFQLLKEKYFWSIFSDSNDNIWAGYSNGVYRYDGKDWNLFELPITGIDDSFISNKTVWSISEAANGDIWFSTNGHGAIRYDGQSFEQFTEKEGLSDNAVDHLIHAKDGKIWMGTRFGGISVLDGKNFLDITEDEVIKNGEVCIVYEDSEQNIWFGVEGYGVYKYDGKEFKNYFRDQGLQVGAPQTIFEDKEGNLWVGGGGGLFRLKGEYFVNIKKNGPWK